LCTMKGAQSAAHTFRKTNSSFDGHLQALMAEDARQQLRFIQLFCQKRAYFALDRNSRKVVWPHLYSLSITTIQVATKAHPRYPQSKPIRCRGANINRTSLQQHGSRCGTPANCRD
jgi:hypothetical protein